MGPFDFNQHIPFKELAGGGGGLEGMSLGASLKEAWFPSRKWTRISVPGGCQRLHAAPGCMLHSFVKKTSCDDIYFARCVC